MAFEIGCRGLVGKSLRIFLVALEFIQNVIEEIALLIVPKDISKPLGVEF
jgi:hypothetical protein